MKKLLLSTLILLGLFVMGANPVTKADSTGDDWLNENPAVSDDGPAVRTVLVEKAKETAETVKVYYGDEWWHENPHLYDEESFVGNTPEKTVEGEGKENIQYGDYWWHENPHLF